MLDEKRKICIVTGADSGIGYETALSLAIAGREVILACRVFAEGNQAVMKMSSLLRQLDGGGRGMGKAVFMELDLASAASIRTFVEGFKKRYSACDLVVCNAGILGGPHTMTEDGFESHFQVNYLGHALLVKLLLPFLKAAGGARVVSVTSRAEKAAYAAGDFLEAARRPAEGFKARSAYGSSKLYQVLYTKKAQELFGPEGISFYSVDPGATATPMLLGFAAPAFRPFLAPFLRLVLLLGLLKNPRKGSETIVHLALSPEPPEGGACWAEKKPRTPPPSLSDPAAANEIWTETEKLLAPLQAGR